MAQSDNRFFVNNENNDCVTCIICQLIFKRLLHSVNTDMKNHVIVLVGNKADLYEMRQVKKEILQQLAGELRIP